MNNQKVITMCHWRRPEYSRDSINHLSRCFGIKDYSVFIHIDGKGDANVKIECERLKPHVKALKITKHQSHLGCNQTTRLALTEGFAHSDYVIHCEDDVLLAKDSLRFFEWAFQFESDKTLFTTNAWRHHYGWLPKPHQDRPWIPGHERWVSTFTGFFVWGWATWKSRWKEMERGWTKGKDREKSWDTALTREVRAGRLSLLPLIGRSNNIGAKLGTHRGAAWIPHWAESPGFVYPESFERIPTVPPCKTIPVHL